MKVVSPSLGANKTSGDGQSGTSGHGTKSEVNAIVGAIGGVASLGVLCLGIFFHKRRTQKKKGNSVHPYVVTNVGAQRYSNALKVPTDRLNLQYDMPPPEAEAAIQQEDASASSNGVNALTGLQSHVIRREIARYLEDRSSLLDPPSYASEQPR